MKFSHAIFDDAFDEGLCLEAAESWPALNWDGWNAVYHANYQKKRACNDWLEMPCACFDLLQEMLLLDLRKFGFGQLIPDMSLWGGGMHSLCEGGVLGLHLDADHHAQVGLPRVLNGILFLNETWENGWGGNLEIWDAQRTRPIVQIAPVFNRLVLFATGDTTWHGVPQRLTCPPDVQRKTLAVWWYGAGDGNGQRERAYFADQGENHA